MTCDSCLNKYGCREAKFGESVRCMRFKDETEWFHLPCKVGDTVYYLTGIHKTLIKPAIIKEIIFDTTGVKDLFVSSDTCDFENSFDIFYLTKEEAEKALKEEGANCAIKEVVKPFMKEHPDFVW